MRQNIILTLLSVTLTTSFSYSDIGESCYKEKTDLALLNQQSKFVEGEIKKMEKNSNNKMDSEVLGTLLSARQNKEAPSITLRIGSEKKVVNAGSNDAKNAQINVYNEYLRKIKLDIERTEMQISKNECTSELKDCQEGTKITDENICEAANDSDRLKINESASSLKDFNRLVAQDLEKLKKIKNSKSKSGLSTTKVQVRSSIVNLLALLPLVKTQVFSGDEGFGFVSIAEAATRIDATAPDLMVDLSDMQIDQLMDSLNGYKNALEIKADQVRKSRVSDESKQKFQVN